MQNSFVAGIVTEYNPFHLGHKWMVDELKQKGASAVVCVMSGNFVQRGTPALFPADVRAKAAVASGVDLVVRLPLAWAASSAETFARGSVGLLSALSVIDRLAFGAESPDAGKLLSIARLLEQENTIKEMRPYLDKGQPFAVARSIAAEKLLPGAGLVLNTPNNILGIEYCKALLALGEKNKIEPFPLPRQGAAHDGPPQSGYASASWLRRIGESDIKIIENYVPASAMPYYIEAEEKGAMIDWAKWETCVLARLKGKSNTDFALCPSVGEGLEHKMQVAVRNALTIEQLYSELKSKRYAHSRLRRLVLEATLGMEKGIPMHAPYVHILAASDKGIELLKTAKQKSEIPVSTSLKKLEKTSKQAKKYIMQEVNADDLYNFSRKIPISGGESYRQPVFILK